MSKKHIRIISHTHWDREWYLNAKYVNEWLVDFFNSLFDMFEREPEYKFMLDGQMSIVEDLLAEVHKAGLSTEEYKKKICKYVDSKNLFIGPYYLQPDWQLISEESAVRNLLIGRNIAEELGGPMLTGWLLDNFGQISQTAQIHKEFGIDGLFMWRGATFSPDKMSTEFLWESPDGTQITAVYLMSGYRNAMRLAEKPEIMKERMQFEADKLIPFGNTDNVLLLNGYDQEIEADNILPYIRNGNMDDTKYIVSQTSPDRYIADIIRETKGKLPVLKGQLYNGRYGSVFPGILSSKMYIKQRNEFSERLLESYAERLCTMLHMMGHDYPADRLNDAWRLIIKSHPHDSICTVSIDDVATDMLERYDAADAISYELIAAAGSLLSSNVATNGVPGAMAAYVAVNTLFFDRNIIVEIPDAGDICSFKDATGNLLLCSKDGNVWNVEVNNVPACGYTTIYAFNQDYLDVSVSVVPQNVLENENIRAVIEKNGTITMTDKKSCMTYSGLLCYEEGADIGDTYSYSYLEGEEKIYSDKFDHTITCECNNGLVQRYRIETVMEVPSKYIRDKKVRSSERRELPITTFVTLEKNATMLKFRTCIKNTAKDHRIRALLPTGLAAESSYSQTQFDITEHEIDVMPYAMDFPPEVAATIKGAYEPMPATNFPQRLFCGVEDRAAGLSVINKGLPEYEVLPEKRTIALTLMRGVGVITNFDFPTRIGDAGPVILTPEAQCLRDMTFEFAIYPYTGSRDTSGVTAASEEFNAPVMLWKTDIHGAGLDPVCNFVTVTDTNNCVAVSAMKCAENNSGTIIRLYNNTAKSTEVTIDSPIKITGAKRLKLSEEVCEELAVTNNSVRVEVLAGKIVTVLLMTAHMPVLVYNEYRTTDIVKGKVNSCDFSQYISEPLLEDGIVKHEQERVAHLIAEVKQAKADIDAFDVSDKLGYSKAVMREEALARELYEATISALLVEKKQLQIGDKNGAEYVKRLVEIDEELRKTGMLLNIRRISKRKQEYIVDFFTETLRDEK